MGKMDSVSVSHLGRVASFAIMVDGARTVNNFIATVTVHISYTQVVIPLPGIIFATGVITIEYPVFFQFFPVPAEGSQDGAGVIPPAHHYTWMNSIQIGYTSQKTVAAVGTFISPIGRITALRDIVNRVQCFSRQSGKYG